METQTVDRSAKIETTEPNKKTSGAQSIKKVGYLLLTTSCLLYTACEFFDVKDNLFMIFFLHYFLGITYAVVLIINGAFGIRKSWRKQSIHKTIILLNLFLLSAFALNRELTVFADSVTWLCVYILLTSVTLLSFAYWNQLPQWINKLQSFLLGSAAVLYLYLALYVANFYLFGSIGVIAFGIGGHIFVPLTLLTGCIALFVHHRKQRINNSWIIAGIILPIVIAITFMIEWNSRISKIETLVNQSVMYNTTEIPIWVNVAQSLKHDWISERILKTDLVYTTVNKHFNDWQFMPRNVTWDEIKKHDPLVFLSSLKSKSSISSEERVKIIKAISNGRHQANERLWSGDNLSTTYIVSDVDIYPELRLAYTEKYLNVKNNSSNGSWWGNTEEGIYTFYLAEGSVVTSLSLWIDGKEQKGILTSKQKATKAYQTIVGVERRDPSVIHWQEGNTVTVRVFPCTTNEERKFKIGITSPLQEEDGNILYKNIVFDGPNPSSAKETKRIRFIGETRNLSIPDYLQKNKKGDYTSEKNYDPDFQISFKATPLKPNKFTFDGFSYSLEAYKPTFESTSFKKVFLDINNSWNKDEIDALEILLGKYKVYVYADEECIQLDAENWATLTTEMQNLNFSLFPFHKISDPAQALVVTKGKTLSPHLSDMKDSKFSEVVSNFFAAGNKINVFSLEGRKSTYIASLQELRGLEYTQGSISELKSLLEKKIYPKSNETDNYIILHDADMVITKTEKESNSSPDNAPDHLARLFAYNNIMRKVGSSYFNNDFINEALVDEAATAYIVSPVSSLIVLETEEDYKRFGITDKENSLHNATKQSSGAVPEPHEWALIILFLLFALYLKFRN